MPGVRFGAARVYDVLGSRVIDLSMILPLRLDIRAEEFESLLAGGRAGIRLGTRLESRRTMAWGGAIAFRAHLRRESSMGGPMCFWDDPPRVGLTAFALGTMLACREPPRAEGPIRDSPPIQERVNVAGRYGGLLAVVGEPDLSRIAEDADVYRALWLRSFHDPVSVRLVRRGNRMSVITAQAERRPDESFSGARHDSLPLDTARWNEIARLAATSDFWAMAAPGPEPGEVRLDGARWILEARVDGRYHVVDWWSPAASGTEKEAAFRAFFLKILSQGTVPLRADEVY